MVNGPSTTEASLWESSGRGRAVRVAGAWLSLATLAKAKPPRTANCYLCVRTLVTHVSGQNRGVGMAPIVSAWSGLLATIAEQNDRLACPPKDRLRASLAADRGFRR